MCDPIDDPGLYIRVAQENGLNIRYVIDTHLHADHVSGGRRLAEISGAAYVLHESADTRYGFHCVRDGEVLDLGNVNIQVLHTPGHTPEHISLLVTDKTRAPEPWFLLTGHTLMVGDVGRTELDRTRGRCCAIIRNDSAVEGIPRIPGDTTWRIRWLSLRSSAQWKSCFDDWLRATFQPRIPDQYG